MMMRWRKGRLLSILAIAGVVIVPGLASAQDTGVTEREVEEVTEGVWESPFILTFRGGPLGFSDSEGDYTSRMSEGLNLHYNITKDANVKIGAETGFQYSHLGSADSGFFGDSDEGDVNAGANSFIVPLQAVIGYNFTDKFHLAAHLGGSLLYRSIGQSMQLGRDGDDSTDNETDIFPSAALNAGYSLGQNTALTLRGDYIPTSADDIVVATLGLGLGF